MSKKKSRFAQKGGSTITWGAMRKFGLSLKSQFPSNKTLRKRREKRILANRAELKRQEVEAGTNWFLVDLLLKSNEGLSLADAKRIAGSTTI